jgi:hypothetical protein
MSGEPATASLLSEVVGAAYMTPLSSSSFSRLRADAPFVDTVFSTDRE